MAAAAEAAAAATDPLAWTAPTAANGNGAASGGGKGGSPANLAAGIPAASADLAAKGGAGGTGS